MVHRPDEIQATNDLVWAITSPSLLNNVGSASQSANDSDDPNDPGFNPPSTWQFEPTELVSFVAARKSHRVGHYFESLVEFWLEKIRKVELVASGLQVRDGSRTIGELDFVFRDEQQRLNHWEAAIKFYLHFPDAPHSNSQFIGPNAADNFEKKTNRMFSHQLALSDEVFPDVEFRHAFVKGIIFYHPLTEMPVELPDRLALDHLHGKWIRQSELELIQSFETLLDCEGKLFSIMQKPFWLTAESTAHSGKSVQTELLEFHGLKQTLDAHFAAKAHPVMVSCLVKNSDSLRETERMFVVSDIWPNSDIPNRQH